MSTYIDTILSANENLLIYRSDSLTLVIPFFEDEDHTITYDALANWDELKMTVRENYDSLKEVIVLELGSGISVVDNVMTLVFTSEQMNLLNQDFVYDIEGKTGAIVGTVLRGCLKRANDVTKNN